MTMNTNLIMMERPYNVLMCGGQIIKHAATLVATYFRGENVTCIETQSYPISEYGIAMRTPMDETDVIGREGTSIDFYDLPPIVYEFTKNLPLMPISFLLSELNRNDLGIDIPPDKDFIIPIRIASKNGAISIVENTDRPFIRVPQRVSHIYSALDDAIRQINDYRMIFPYPIHIRTSTDKSEYEEYMNCALSEFEATNT